MRRRLLTYTQLLEPLIIFNTVTFSLRIANTTFTLQGQSENGEYLQAWQFSTIPGRIVTAVRVSDMGIFFLIIEISSEY